MKFGEAVAIGLTTTSLIFGAACNGDAGPRHSDQTEEAVNALKEMDRVDRFAKEGSQTFNHDIRIKHEASFMIGLCMGWENRTGNNVTVTLNPGVGVHTQDGRRLEMIMAGNVKKSAGDSPHISFRGDIFTYARPHHSPVSEIEFTKSFSTGNSSVLSSEKRHVTVLPAIGPGGIVSYMDRETGQPLGATIEVEEPFTDGTVLGACDKLQPGFSGTVQTSPAPSGEQQILQA
jgi:hypothetical protein